MFEQEAEMEVLDYTIKSRDCIMFPCKTLEDCQCQDFDFEEVVELFRRGAEFGYKEGKKEWHYVENGDLPKVKSWVIGFYYGNDNWHKIFYREDGKWWGEGQLCQPPYAWKEIVPPKE